MKGIINSNMAAFNRQSDASNKGLDETSKVYC